ncbi:GNAT family N-acetyltransferase [Carnobacterium divergens]|uniref:GNAT family N-acetyltransferase n=1 Tax=Carnobacterium divergens TaxID=2748 RepID=UPI00288D2BF4|nr:GNAT family N-acetyltransferase [Carnobacterium divergens]MDT2011822.1 GNAT family N-acetyltransferase [Carnobacterium divergens]
MHLKKMTQSDFDDFLSLSILDYAKDKVAAGTWSGDEAIALATTTFNELLPKGIHTENEFLFSIIEPSLSSKVGYLWFHAHHDKTGKSAFIYDFVIFEPFRGSGYGTKAIEILIKEIKTMHFDKISLHVFGHNEVALSLYKKMGFVTTDINMTRYL